MERLPSCLHRRRGTHRSHQSEISAVATGTLRLCHVASFHLRTLLDGRPHRARLQHRRACDQTPNNYKKEQSMRLFAGSDGGGRTWATIATLLQTAKMNNVDPQAWLAQTLERIAQGWPSSEIDALMPWNYA